MSLFRQTRWKGIRLVMALVLMLGLIFPGSAMAAKDWEGHWAEGVIEAWLELGLVSGYEDGSIQPDKSISRAEFMAFVNRAFNFTEKTSAQFKDVSSSDWYADVVQKAVAAGYIAGYPDGTMKPNNDITRMEAAAILARITGLSANEGAAYKFSDQAQIPQWSRGVVGAVAQSSLMVGYPDGSFMPAKEITRAEAIAALNKARNILTTFDKAGTYGHASATQTYSGNVVVMVPGVTLQNMVIKGNLILDKGIGEGDVTLNNVTVEGDTFVRGGGANSIHINGGQYKNIFIEKQDGRVRIVATDAEGVRVVMEAPDIKGNEVILEGDFESVVVNTPEVKVTVQGETTIKNLEVTEKATATSINLNSGVKVEKAILETKTTVTGQGTIREATGSGAKDSTYEKEPTIIKDDAQPTVPVGGGGGGTSTPALSVSNIRFILANVVEPVETLEDLDDTVRVKGIVFDINAKGTSLTVTGIKLANGSTIGYDFTKKFADKAGEVTFSELLNKESISLGDLRGFFGKEFTIEGTLTLSGYQPYTNFAVNLGGTGQDYAGEFNEWVSVEFDGQTNTLKATIIKDDLLKNIGIRNILTSTFNELPAKVKIGDTEFDVTTQAAAIKDALGDWDTMKISGLVDMELQMQRTGSTVWYTIEVIE